MKILFLCGSLAPGRDGVGDYTRRLAGELIRQGHLAAIVALNDRMINVLELGTQEVDSIIVPVLRLPAIMSNKKRYSQAKQYIDMFNPEWLSLQFVPFSFQDKGLPLGLGRQLGKIGIGRKWHIMFHELWVGMNDEASLKLKVWGEVQRLIIIYTLALLNPILIHTQTKLYLSKLIKLRLDVEYLPIFGNIPVAESYLKKSIQNSNEISFVVFGSIRKGIAINELAKKIKYFAKENDKEIEITFIGRCGSELNVWVEVFKREQILVNVLGEKSPEQISEILSKSNIGISSTPYLLSEKSGVVATMLEHNLHIICVEKKWTIKNFKFNINNERILKFENIDFTHFLTDSLNDYEANTLKNVTNKLISSLSNS